MATSCGWAQGDRRCSNRQNWNGRDNLRERVAYSAILMDAPAYNNSDQLVAAAGGQGT